MSKLDEDLSLYADEAFTKHDVKAGLKLISEILGIISLAAVALWVVNVLLPAIGLPISAGVAAQGAKQLARAYSDMDEEDRHKIRAVVKWARRGLGLFF